MAKIESSPYAGTDIANVVKRYINADRINQGQTYYLMSGGLKKITVANKAYDPANPTGTSHNEYDGALPKFDFVNNNTTDQWFGPELPVVKDAAMWILEKVDDTNYFGVKPSTNMRGRDGKYYTTLYVDFPFQIKGDVKAYTIEGVEAKNADGYYLAKVKKLAQQGDVVQLKPLSFWSVTQQILLIISCCLQVMKLLCQAITVSAEHSLERLSVA